jgi:hypothetical protein
MWMETRKNRRGHKCTGKIRAIESVAATKDRDRQANQDWGEHLNHLFSWSISQHLLTITDLLNSGRKPLVDWWLQYWTASIPCGEAKCVLYVP